MERIQTWIHQKTSAVQIKNEVKWFQCQKQCEKCLDEKEHCAEGKKKLHSPVWGQCTLTMQNELEAMEGCEKLNKQKNPIKLLSVIEGV